MYIKELELKDFRNYSEEKIDFDRNVNLILGNNAQGKTNLIEAVYLSAFGKSFRTHRDGDMIKFGSDAAKVNLTAEKRYGETFIEINLMKGSKKCIKKNRIPLTNLSEILNDIYIVVFSPEDLRLVKDDPEKRRKFIDSEMCQISPRYCNALSGYKKTLSQRNAFLKSGKSDRNLMEIWDMQLSGYGASVIKEREKFIEKLGEFSNVIHGNITGGKECLEIKYDSDIKVKETEEEQREKLKIILEENFEKDQKSGYTGRGPHRDDLGFYIGGIDTKKFGSQGQQRTCALSLKLAELSLIKEETGEDAILLLDDVMSELDIERQQYLIESLSENQIFVTTTDLDINIKKRFSDARIFRIENGRAIRDI